MSEELFKQFKIKHKTERMREDSIISIPIRAAEETIVSREQTQPPEQVLQQLETLTTKLKESEDHRRRLASEVTLLKEKEQAQHSEIESLKNELQALRRKFDSERQKFDTFKKYADEENSRLQQRIEELNERRLELEREVENCRLEPAGIRPIRKRFVEKLLGRRCPNCRRPLRGSDQYCDRCGRGVN